LSVTIGSSASNGRRSRKRWIRPSRATPGIS
jgi:hypothetical protein